MKLFEDSDMALNLQGGHNSFEHALSGFPGYQMAGFVLLLSICAILPAWMNYDIIARDGAGLYIPVARCFLDGRFSEAQKYVPIFPLPLYETLIFVTAKLSGLTLEVSGRLVSAVSFCAGAVGIYKLTEALFKNRLAGLISVLFYLSHRKLLGYSVDCLKESLFVCMILWANFLVVKGINSNWKSIYFIFGVILFLAGTLVRSTSLIFVSAWLLIWIFHEKKTMLIKSLVLLALISAITAFLYLNPDSPLFRNNSLNVNLFSQYLKSSFAKPNYIMHASLNFLTQFMAVTY